MKLSKEKTKYFKEKLEEEKKRLEGNLSQVGKENPDVPGDWVPTAPDLNMGTSDKNDLADTFEEMENRAVIEDSLEEQLTFVDRALERIKKSGYGVCSKCGEPIDEARLEVNPAAFTCVEHA